VDGSEAQSEANAISVRWFEARFNQQLNEINDLYSKYRISEVLMTSYKLIWDDFCAWYLEMIKPEFVDGKALPLDKATYDATIGFLEKLLKVIHPFMPFISEEIWHLIKERKEKECILISQWPVAGAVDENLLGNFELASEVIVNIRNIRKQKNISPKEKLDLLFKGTASESDRQFVEVIAKLANLGSYSTTPGNIPGAFSFLVKQFEYFIPVTQDVNLEQEKERLVKELEYNRGFLDSVAKKLGNERFVQNAKPEILENEHKKKADAEAKIKAIQEQLTGLS
jgi:valyl-tRNA synthetase